MNGIRATLVTIGVELVMAGSFLAFPMMSHHSAVAHADTCFTQAWQPMACPDPTDRIQEDDPGWNCVTMGDRVCGPGNSNDVPAGCYDDGGVIVAPWPCHIVVNPDGSSDVYAP